MHHDHDHEWTVPGPPTLKQPDEPATCAAQDQVLHTPELLEKILAGCGDMRAVLLAQRVSLFWHELIRDSSLLQCMLYFEAVPPFAPDEGLSPEELRDGFSVNPLLRHYFTEWLRQYPHMRQSRPDNVPAPETHGVISFARHRCGECGHGSGTIDIDIDTDDGAGATREAAGAAVVVVPLFPPGRRREAFTRAGASWRRMLVCQPASMALGFRQGRAAGTMPTYGDGAHLRRPWPNPGWRQQPVMEEVWQFLTTKEIRGFLDTASSSSSPVDDECEGGGLRMGTLYDVCLVQHLHYSTLQRQDRHPYFRLHWLPPGHAGVFPYNSLQSTWAFTPGLGVSAFAVLEDVEHHWDYSVDGRLLKTRLLTTEELETFRCEEHTERLFTPVETI
ncbi:f-box domain protein [Apiospora saccharicola]